MNNPYASPNYAAPQPPPVGGYGMAPEPYRATDGAQATEMSMELLRQTKPWVTFLAVMGFIGSVCMLLGGVVMMIAGAVAPRSSAMPFPPMLLGLMYVPLALLYIYPSLKLWGFSRAIGRLLATRMSVDLEAALSQQKSFWKFLGILTVVMIALYVLMFVGIMIAGFAAASSIH